MKTDQLHKRASGLLKLKLVVVDENTENIGSVFPYNSDNLAAEELKYIKVKDLEKYFMRAVKQVREKYKQNLTHIVPGAQNNKTSIKTDVVQPAEAVKPPADTSATGQSGKGPNGKPTSKVEMPVSDQLSNTFLIYPKLEPNRMNQWEFGNKKRGLRFWEKQWLNKNYKEENIASALKISAEDIETSENNIAINFYVPLEFQSNASCAAVTSDFQEDEFTNDVHLWAIPLLPKKMEHYYERFYGQILCICGKRANSDHIYLHDDQLDGPFAETYFNYIVLNNWFWNRF